MDTQHEFIVMEGQKVFQATPPEAFTTVYKLSTQPAELCIIVPLFERKEVSACLNYCLKSLRHAARKATIVIIDQSLDAAILEVVRRDLSRIAKASAVANLLYHYDPNHTISSAKNYGIRLVHERFGDAACGDYIVLLDSDVYIHKHTIAELFRAAQQAPEVGAFSFPVSWIRKHRDISLLHRTYSPGAVMPDFHKPEPELTSRMAQGRGSLLLTPAIHGCLLAVRTNVMHAVGGFMPFFAMHGEHVELCARLRDKGHVLAYIMHAPIFHDDRPTLTHSVTRDLRDREQYIIATIIAMMARNRMHRRRRRERFFLELVRRKWLVNLAIPAGEMKAIISLLLRLSHHLRVTYPRQAQFERLASRMLEQYVGSAVVKGYVQTGIAYIQRNYALLLPLFGNVPGEMPLYAAVE